MGRCQQDLGRHDTSKKLVAGATDQPSAHYTSFVKRRRFRSAIEIMQDAQGSMPLFAACLQVTTSRFGVYQPSRPPPQSTQTIP